MVISFLFSSVLILTTGTIFAMWLGEKITDKGIGNGISLLITVGIIANFPAAFLQEFVAKTTNAGAGGVMMVLIEIILWFVVILLTVLLVTAVRKIAVQYARRTVAGNVQNVAGSRDYIPLKLNAAGVMPIIFAQAIMTIPVMLFSSTTDQAGFLQRTLGDPYGVSYNVLLAILIIVFTYFYTAIMINPRKIADELKRSGGFIPGVRPGEETSEYIDSLVSRITFPGSMFLAFIAIIPAIAYLAGVNGQFAMFFGGTSLLIMVGVVLDTLQQIESYLLNRQMDGLMEGTRVKGRRTANELTY